MTTTATRAKDAAFWNRLAPRYFTTKIKNTEGYEFTLSRIASYLNPGDEVLELGCGTGSTAVRLAGGVSRYLATDIAEGMITIARQQAVDASLPVLEAEVATVDQIEGQFDAVLGFNLIHLLRDQRGDLARIHGLVKPGGLFISKTPCKGGFFSPLNLASMIALPVMQLLGKAPYVDLTTVLQLEQMITDAGFEIIESGNHPTRFIVARRR